MLDKKQGKYFIEAVKRDIDSGPYISYLKMKDILYKANGELRKELLAFNNFAVFVLAVNKSHIEILQEILKAASPKQREEMIAFNDFQAFRMAANSMFKPSTQILQEILKAASPEQREEMIAFNNFQAFRLAVNSMFKPSTRIVQEILNAASPQQRKEMIAFNNFEILMIVVNKSHIEILQEILKAASPEQREEMIAFNDFQAFRMAVGKSHIEIVQEILNAASPQQREEMIAFYKIELWELVKSSIKHINEPTNQKLKKLSIKFVDIIFKALTPEDIAQMLDPLEVRDIFDIFDLALFNNYQDIVKKILIFKKEKIKDLLDISDIHSNLCFSYFCLTVDIVFVRVLLNAATPEQREKMIAFNDFESLRLAVDKSHIEIVQEILNAASPQQRAEMIAFECFKAFRMAANNNIVDLFKMLLHAATPEQRDEMLISKYYSFFNNDWIIKDKKLLFIGALYLNNQEKFESVLEIVKGNFSEKDILYLRQMRELFAKTELPPSYELAEGVGNIARFFSAIRKKDHSEPTIPGLDPDVTGKVIKKLLPEEFTDPQVRTVINYLAPRFYPKATTWEERVRDNKEKTSTCWKLG